MFKKYITGALTVGLLFSGIGTVSAAEDEIISYPTNLDNISSSLTWEDDDAKQLFVSNSPEHVYRRGILGLSSEVNETGKFRVYWAHKNSYAPKNYFGFALYNDNNETVKVILEKRAHRETDSGSSEDSGKMGQKLLREYLDSSSKDYEYATLDPGEYTYIGFGVEQGGYSTGMYDVKIEDTDGNRVKGGITLKTYSTFDAKGNPKSALEENMILKDDGNQIRGLFPAAQKELTWKARVDEEISFTSTVNNRWDVPDNDLAKGIDETTGKRVYNYGGYGLIYRVKIQPREDLSIVFAPQLASDQPSDRDTHYLAIDAGDRDVITNNVDEGDGWIIKDMKDNDSMSFYTSLPGYHWAPLRLAAIPTN
jgi:hypothetical protein